METIDQYCSKCQRVTWFRVLRNQHYDNYPCVDCGESYGDREWRKLKARTALCAPLLATVK
jgi:hypothetical protein